MNKNDVRLSIIKRVPASYFVYSAFSYFAKLRGGELPGGWFVRALGRVGREEAAVRQTLYRMERDGELRTRREGRRKFYAPTPYASAEIEAGTRKIFEDAPDDWDGQWTLVRVGLRSPALATERERVIALLAVEGFARMEANLFVHPRSRAERLRQAASRFGKTEILILRGDLLGKEGVHELIALWNLDGLAERYRRALDRFEKLERASASGLADEDAFLLRFAMVFEYLEIAWDDPELPSCLLPADWPGVRARHLAAKLYERYLPGAIRVADAMLAEALDGSSASVPARTR